MPRAWLCLLCLLLGLVLGACRGPGGLSGPDLPEAKSAEGPCFEADLTDGFQDGDEVLVVFACFNQHGAFDDLEDLVVYLATSELLETFLDAANETLRSVDVVGLLEMSARLVRSDEDPLGRAARLYVEAVDAGLILPTLGIAREVADAMTACEQGDDPPSCSVPRLGRAVLDTEVPDQLSLVLDALEQRVSEEDRGAMLQALAELMQSSSARNPDNAGGSNALLDLGRFLLEPDASGATPVEQLLPYLQVLLSDDLDGDGDDDPDPRDDNLVQALASPLARLWREGLLQALPADLEYLLTHDSRGREVGWDGANILDELLEATAPLSSDPDLLYQEFTLPGEDEPTTLLEFLLDTADALYLNGADVTAIVEKLEEMVDLMCGGDAPSALCDLTADTLPPLVAAVENTAALPSTLLPLAYALHQTADMTVVVDLAFLALDLDLLGRTATLTDLAVQAGLVEQGLVVVPVFIDTDLGRLTPAGEAAQELGIFLLNPFDPSGGGQTVVPALVPLDLARQVLSPAYPNADLDAVLWTLGGLLQDEESGFHPDNLAALLEDLQEAMDAERIDLVAEARELLDDEALWTAALALGADAGLIDLLVPVEGRPGAAWYLYALIAEGTLDRILALTAALLDLLVDEGLLDAESSE